MPETLTVDLCVIGGGSAGLSVAAGAVQMGSSVALIEKHKMGRDPPPITQRSTVRVSGIMFPFEKTDNQDFLNCFITIGIKAKTARPAKGPRTFHVINV